MLLKKENLFLRVAVGFVFGVLLGLTAKDFSIATKMVGDLYLNLIKLMIIPIVVCLFVKHAAVTEIHVIASHIQALEQCRGTLTRDYPEAVWKEEEDTAIAARHLAEGLLPEDAGVLCRRDAGEAFGLCLMRENLEDDAENATEFELIRLSEKGPDKLAVVAGLGLLGGSMAKALKRYTGYTVYGWNRTRSVAEGTIDGIAGDGDFAQVGFRRVKVCDARTHDRMIAHTSQLAHIVSNSYVKSPVSPDYVGFSGGSYKDMTRIACLDERVWKELFLLNRGALLPEIDLLVRHMSELRDAIWSGDGDRLEELLRLGREAKERIDALNPDQPSE